MLGITRCVIFGVAMPPAGGHVCISVSRAIYLALIAS